MLNVMQEMKDMLSEVVSHIKQEPSAPMAPAVGSSEEKAVEGFTEIFDIYSRIAVNEQDEMKEDVRALHSLRRFEPVFRSVTPFPNSDKVVYSIYIPNGQAVSGLQIRGSCLQSVVVTGSITGGDLPFLTLEADVLCCLRTAPSTWIDLMDLLRSPLPGFRQAQIQVMCRSTEAVDIAHSLVVLKSPLVKKSLAEMHSFAECGKCDNIGKTAEMRLYANHPSFGLLIVFHDYRTAPMDEVLNNVSLVLNDQVAINKLPADSVRWPQYRKAYYVKFPTTLNFTRIDKVKLSLEMKVPERGSVMVYNRYKNFLQSEEHSMGLRFAV